MSALVCVKHRGAVVLATDSRATSPDFTRTEHDRLLKMVQIGPEAFFASSGWVGNIRHQIEVTHKLADELGTGDVVKLADALVDGSREKLGHMLAILTSLRGLHPAIEAAVSGLQPLHGWAFIGRDAEGRLGWAYREAWVTPEGITIKSTDWFADDIGAVCTHGESVRRVIFNADTWSGGAVQGAHRLLSALEFLNPAIGGPTQMAVIDSAGARWLHRLPDPADVPALATATLAAGVVYAGSLTANQVTSGRFIGRDLELAIGGEVVTIDANNGQNTAAVMVTSSTSVSRQRSYRFEVWSPGYEYARFGYLMPAALSVNWDTSRVEVRADGTPGVYVKGSKVVGERYTGSVTTLADVIAALRAHGLIT